MRNVVIKYSAILLLFINIAYSQDELQQTGQKLNNKSPVIKIDGHDKQPRTEKTESRILDNPELVLNRLGLNSKQSSVYNFRFPNTLVSSFNNNFHFAGFWNKYAIINVTPQMYIKPFDFISIYANHSTSMYIPIAKVKEHFKSLAVEGAAVLAIDNSVKFLFSSKPLLQSVVNFIAKNIAISFIKKSFEGEKITEFKYYYYAVSIRF